MIKNFKSWIVAATIRAIKTFAQTFLAMIGSNAMFVGDVNWGMVISGSALAAILSFATSVVGLPEVSSKDEASEGD